MFSYIWSSYSSLYRGSSLNIPLHRLYILLFSMFSLSFFSIISMVFSLKILEEMRIWKLAEDEKGFTFINIDSYYWDALVLSWLTISDVSYSKKSFSTLVSNYLLSKIVNYFLFYFMYSTIFPQLLSMKPGNLLVYSLISHFCIFLISP